MQFYERLQKEIFKYKNKHELVAGDLNTRVGNSPIPKVVGSFGGTHINDNEHQLRQFAIFNSLKISNTLFVS